MNRWLLTDGVGFGFTYSTHTNPTQSCTNAHVMQAISARWCIPAEADAATTAACTAAVAGANAPGASFSCVAGGSQEACLDMISKGQADLITLGGECSACCGCVLCVLCSCMHATAPLPYLCWCSVAPPAASDAFSLGVSNRNDPVQSQSQPFEPEVTSPLKVQPASPASGAGPQQSL